MESVKGDIFTDKVYVFTPKGDVKELPQGSSPIDFAYSIHTDVGNQTTGAIVNGKMMPLHYKLQNGDIVEILTSNQSFGPGRDWLNYVVTTRAKNKIKHFFKVRNSEENEMRGKEILNKVFVDKHLNSSQYLTKENIQKLCEELDYKNEHDLWQALGVFDVKTENVVTKLLRFSDNSNRKSPQIKTKKLKLRDDGGVVIQGMDSLLVRMSHCCNPVPGDEIKGYITKGRGISIHRADCINVENVHSDRIIDVEWADEFTLAHYGYRTNVEIIGENRDGLLNDVLQVIHSLDVDLISVTAKPTTKQLAKMVLSIQVNDKYQLYKVVDKIKTVPYIDSVKRIEAK